MTESYYHILKKFNLKVTPKRIAILESLASAASYMTPDEVWKDIKGRFNQIGLPTIYRNLEELAGYGIISKVIHPDRRLYYYFCQNRGHHHHFICLSCRKVEEINMCNISEMQQDIENTINGKVLNHILQLNGLCSECLMSENNNLNFHADKSAQRNMKIILSFPDLIGKSSKSGTGFSGRARE